MSKELSSPGVSSEDVAKRLRDLNELRKEGILDDEEFLVAKRQLLGGAVDSSPCRVLGNHGKIEICAVSMCPY